MYRRTVAGGFGIAVCLMLASCTARPAVDSSTTVGFRTEGTAQMATSPPTTGLEGVAFRETDVDQMIASRDFRTHLDIAEYHHDCLELHGIMTEVVPTGGVAFEPYPSEQTPYIEATEMRCWEKLGEVLEPLLNNNDPQRLRRAYARAESIRACLAREGVPIDPLPSFDSWIEDRSTWDPFGNLIGEDLGRFNEMHVACPELLDLNL
jgi:hypothetical protein